MFEQMQMIFGFIEIIKNVWCRNQWGMKLSTRLKFVKMMHKYAMPKPVLCAESFLLIALMEDFTTINAICDSVLCVLCVLYYVLHIVYCVVCTSYCVMCIVHCVLCVMCCVVYVLCCVCCVVCVVLCVVL